MAHLVRHDEEDLVGVELGENGVPEDDALGVEETGDVGVDRLGVDALVDLEDTTALDSGTLGEGEDLRLELPGPSSGRSR